LSLYVDPRIEKYVQCDDTRLSQVLNNLISNALKFSRAKIKKVTLSVLLDTKASSSDNYRLRFSVWDNGLGISQEQQSRIFKGFMQGSNNTYRQFGGTGLGLSICQRICRLMGAKLNVQSEVGLGSEFWFDVELSLDSKKETISIMPLRESVCVMTNHRLFNENLRQYAQQIGITCVYVPFESMLETNSEQTYFLIDPTQVHDWIWQGITNELTKLKGEYAFLGNNESSGSEHPFIPCSPLKLNQLLGWINDEELGEDNDKFQPEEVSPVMARLEVLVVDDNPDNLYVMEQQFAALGVSGVFCSEPKQAIECFTSDNVNVVISDYQMPEISGAVLIDKLRDIERQLERQPIEMVILSADKSEQCIQACTLSGANDIQLKPLSFERLKALLLEQGMRLSDDLDANKDHSSSDRKIEDMPLASGQDSPHCSLHDRWVDLDVIYKYVGPLNPEQLTRFWAQTVENLKRHRAELSDVLEQDQWQKMGLVAHKIKSSAMYFGAHRLSQQCQDLEEMVTRDLNDNTSLAATCTDALECIEQTILFLEGEVI
jgi:CheY-like chemotaxis protein